MVLRGFQKKRKRGKDGFFDADTGTWDFDPSDLDVTG